MKNILTQIASIGSKAKYALAAVFMTTLLAAPAIQTAVTAQNTVTLETYTFAQNVSSDPDGELSDSTDLIVDEVARVHTWYHNREQPDSGKNAENLRVKLAIPTEAGETQRITGTTSADNAAAVSDTTTINLSLDRARLEVVPNSATWRYNKGAMDGRAECQTGTDRIPQNDPNNCYETEDLSAEQQAALLSPEGLVLEEQYRPCFAYESSVSVQVRSRADAVSVNKYVRPVGGDAEDWKTSMDVSPGDDIEYLIRFQNEGNTQLNDVIVGDNLPDYNKYVPGSTMLSNSNFPDGTSISNDNITLGGINAGDYAPGSAGYVWFKVEIDDIEAYERCGEYVLKNVGAVQPAGMNPYYNTAEITVNVVCDDQPEGPAYECDALTLVKESNRTVVASVDFTANNGATFKDVQINFGDGSDVLTTSEVEDIRYTYSETGNYTVTATVRFNLPNGDMVSDSGDACVEEINFDAPTTPTTPTRLPNTGAGEVVGLFAATTIAGAVAHRFYYGRRFNG